ncbi:uncharacterized protein LOC130731782 isoform X2 [Lotus japonicus]|uniref:uncharacterized protein LOC130731782 isoform X2 n=2 Tax=Lotus japonicus TaxID=34305 RepID=UPI00258A9256|nr:uncharacterized protein LOC130731782 isoform X2 [Lotus japonicus]
MATYGHAIRRDAYKATYDHAISPINGKRMWPYTPDAPILPPVYKRKAGRPKKLRRREPHEDDPEEGARPVPVHRCGRCGGTSHNVKTCPNQVSTQPTTDPIPPGNVTDPQEPAQEQAGNQAPTTAPTPPVSFVQICIMKLIN